MTTLGSSSMSDRADLDIQRRQHSGRAGLSVRVGLTIVTLAFVAIVGASPASVAADPVRFTAADDLVARLSEQRPIPEVLAGAFLHEEADLDGSTSATVLNTGPSTAVSWTLAPEAKNERLPNVALVSVATLSADGTVEAEDAEPPFETELPADGSAFVRFDFHSKEIGRLAGLLVGQAGDTVLTRQVSILAPRWSYLPIPGGWVVVTAFAVAALVIVGRYLNKGERDDTKPLKDAKFQFDKSFASTITAAGAFLATLTAATVLPDESTVISKADVGGLSLLFALTVLLAPIAFRSTRSGIGIKPFFFAAWLTTAGAIGQLATAYLLLAEGLRDQIDRGTYLVLTIVAASTIVMTLWYVAKAIPAAIRQGQAEEPTEQAGIRMVPTERGATPLL